MTVTDVEKYFPLVDKAIHSLRRTESLLPHHEFDDLQSVGRMAAWIAIDKFDPARGASMLTYLNTRIRGALIDYQRSVSRADGWSRHHGRVAHVTSLETPLPTGPDDSPGTLADLIADDIDIDDQVDAIVRLRSAVAAGDRLTGARRHVAQMILTDGSHRGCATQLGVSESRVSQLARDVAPVLAETAQEASGVLLVDRSVHTDRDAALAEAQRVRPDSIVVSVMPRKVRAGRVVAPQGRSAADGSLGRPVWAVWMAAA